MPEHKLSFSEIMRKLDDSKDTLRIFGVVRIGLFGSFARGEQKENSDIDFLVELKKPDFDSFMDLAFFLENLFSRKVELITAGSVSPYIQPYIEKEVKWYEA